MERRVLDDFYISKSLSLICQSSWRFLVEAWGQYFHWSSVSFSLSVRVCGVNRQAPHNIKDAYILFPKERKPIL